MTTELTGVAGAASPQRAPRVLLYSDDVDARAQVRLAVGRRLSRGAPDIEWVETATHPVVVETADRGGLDLLILDGEAAKSGGMGLCRQLKDEIFRCPPVLVLTGRRDDAWLATWSRADGVLGHPVDPMRLPEVVAGLLRGSRAASDVSAPV